MNRTLSILTPHRARSGASLALTAILLSLSFYSGSGFYRRLSGDALQHQLMASHAAELFAPRLLEKKTDLGLHHQSQDTEAPDVVANGTDALPMPGTRAVSIPRIGALLIRSHIVSSSL